ncbi:metal-sensitive transcriptional regulator [Paenibacillus assamensis]|uniref:metal-sensitive transcriptional regulator n=1 Tax=Paenibacillus assamensis TaxID=311244 RepID=UPI0004136DE2|nr:metal-sensitive transcriptional regulator [Paenibacillus assamensis]
MTEKDLEQTAEDQTSCCSADTVCAGHQEDGVRKSHHSAETKQKLVHRLNRIEGQVRGVKSMIERDVYCDQVLHQIASIQSALNSVGKLLLDGHIRSCVVERLQAGEEEVITELLTTMNKLMK